MILSRAPMRISLFGGSTDYKEFYEQHGSVLIGTTIDKYVYTTVRYQPKLIGNNFIVKYSKVEVVSCPDEIQNPLIRETLKYYGITRPVEVGFDADVPSRTGLGGSSACCAALARSLVILTKKKHSPLKHLEMICRDAINIERDILKEPGGIQDQIWAVHGGFNMITISKDGTFQITPMLQSKEFKYEFWKSLVLIYSQQQRQSINHHPVDETSAKLKILDIARVAYSAFQKEDTKLIGQLMLESWKEKRSISPSVSNEKIDSIVDDVINMGAYGAKLLGNGSGGFVLAICDEKVRQAIEEKYQKATLDFRFSKGYIKTISL